MRSRAGSRRSRREDREAGDDAQPRARLRRRILLWSLIGLAVVCGLAAVVWFTPLFSVRTVTVEGLVSIPEPQVLNTLDIADGTPLLQVDTGAAAERVAGIARVAEVRVQRDYPSTLKVTVTERFAAVFFDSPQGTHVMDGSGVDFAIEPPPPGTPRLKVDHPARSDPTTQAALAVLNSTPPPLRVQVAEVAASSTSDIRLTLRDGRVLEWGSKDDSARKASIALPLLTQPGKTYDVSSPDLPTVK